MRRAKKATTQPRDRRGVHGHIERVHSYLKQFFQMRRGSARATTRIIGRLHNFFLFSLSTLLLPPCFCRFSFFFLLSGFFRSILLFGENYSFDHASFPERFVFMILTSHITLFYAHTSSCKCFVRATLSVYVEGILRVWRVERENISAAFRAERKSIKIRSAGDGREGEEHERGHVYGYRSFFFSRWSPRPVETFDVLRFVLFCKSAALLARNDSVYRVLTWILSHKYTREHLLGFLGCLDCDGKRQNEEKIALKKKLLLRSRVFWQCVFVLLSKSTLKLAHVQNFSVRVEEPAKRVVRLSGGFFLTSSWTNLILFPIPRWRNFV